MPLLPGVIGLIGWLAGPASAQISIEVVDSFGRPIPAVRIEVYGRGELIAAHSTSAEGIADLGSERWSEVRRISLRHIGFGTRVVQADDIPSDGVIRLEPEAVPIEGLTVAGRELCPIEGTDEARRVWSEVASSYSDVTETRALSARFVRRAGRVPETDLSRPARSEPIERLVAWSGGIWHGDDFDAKPLSVRAASEGYAWAPIEFGGIRDPGAWRYPDLHLAAANHFANPTFGALHDFVVEGESGGITTLVFCPKEHGGRAGIRGTLRIDPEGRFVSADWRFATPDPQDGAGGSVELYAHFESGDSLPHLMASSGMFFRHSGRPIPYPELPRSYSRDVIEVAGWTVHTAWSHPCGSGRGDGLGGSGGGRFTVFPAIPRTPEGIAFSECIERSWGIGPR